MYAVKKEKLTGKNDAETKEAKKRFRSNKKTGIMVFFYKLSRKLKGTVINESALKNHGIYQVSAKRML